MKKTLAIVVMALCACPVWANGLTPWKFGMSREQVSAFSAQGPYTSFKNGDLETYAGQFNGVDRNVQFYFNQTGLWRISVQFYEGTDAAAARAGWRDAYATLAALYGPVETALSGNGEELANRTAEAVEAGIKLQMAPVRQPLEEYVFSSYQRYVANGKALYRVVVYLDPAHPKPGRVAQLR
jgi:hypothetical protein